MLESKNIRDIKENKGGKIQLSVNDLLKDYYKKKYKINFLFSLEQILRMGFIPNKRQKKFIVWSNGNGKQLLPKVKSYIFEQINISFVYDLNKCKLLTN